MLGGTARLWEKEKMREKDEVAESRHMLDFVANKKIVGRTKVFATLREALRPKPRIFIRSKIMTVPPRLILRAS